MAYEYYCSHCGKQLSQDTVLFDMQYLLTRDDTKLFNILKFRMTQAELKGLLASGTEGENGYKICRLTMADVMRFIGSKNNLNDIYIGALTLEEVNDYINAGTNTNAGKAQSANEAYDDYADDYADDYEEEDLSEEAENPYVKPASIAALENKSRALVDEILIRDLLTTDLSELQTIFADNRPYEFQLREENYTDNEGKPVLMGYDLKTASGSLRIEARVCCKCATKVFEYAGTAKHQAVAFIGSAKAGKTSTILALTHYATYYMDNGFGAKAIWGASKTIQSAEAVQLVEKDDRLEADLRNYGKGIAPKKTPAIRREDAYSVTLRLGNSAEGNKRYLFTLIDLPGELCVDNGKVQWAKVQDLFPVALTCDAFVLCFDTQSLEGDDEGRSPAQLVAEVCNWTDAFQSMRAQHNKLGDTYVPTMVLFTKCEELERSGESIQKSKKMLPQEEMYLLKNEKLQIADNPMYRYVSEGFSKYGKLDGAYHAMMRCSPFGYSAPDIELMEELRKEGKEPDIHIPTPKNIDSLMRWLLSVSGCIPTEASFARNPMDVPFKLHDFCITRPQLRNENPGCSNHKVYGTIDDVKEAMARCTLFENPGYFDEEFVGRHDQHTRLGLLRFEARAKPNANAR